jgi:hypothetical protein
MKAIDLVGDAASAPRTVLSGFSLLSANLQGTLAFLSGHLRRPDQREPQIIANLRLKFPAR